MHPKLEYLTVYFETIIDIDRDLNQFGDDGWELISILPYDTSTIIKVGTRWVGFFKRSVM